MQVVYSCIHLRTSSQTKFNIVSIINSLLPSHFPLPVSLSSCLSLSLQVFILSNYSLSPAPSPCLSKSLSYQTIRSLQLPFPVFPNLYSIKLFALSSSLSLSLQIFILSNYSLSPAPSPCLSKSLSHQTIRSLQLPLPVSPNLYPIKLLALSSSLSPAGYLPVSFLEIAVSRLRQHSRILPAIGFQCRHYGFKNKPQKEETN